jgi:ornithine cyclodeaminase
MREVDHQALRRADIFVDTRGGALSESGELVQALREGVIAPDDIRGDLFQLTRGSCEGRRSKQQITLFKSVGTSLEDLAAAELAASRFLNARDNQPA